MAQFSVDIADVDVARVLNALAVNYRRPEQVPNPEFNPMEPVSEDNLELIDNPETVSQFGNRMVRQFLADNVKAYEVRLAKEQAANSVDTNVTINDPAV
tara:strand:+ start:3841 stop:4137 length:297 start_codon:yes stop_codon:yes gene_type:complete